MTKKLVFIIITFLFTINAIAQDDYETGRHYYDSNDYKSALTFFLRAANKGDYNAQYSLGVMYLEGKGVAINYAKALDWFLKSAEQGHMYAQNQIGQMYYSGSGVIKNIDTAIKWISQSAQQGYDVAQYNLGYIYHEFYDMDKAFPWFEKAANQGNSSAQYELGNYYYIKEDYAKTIKWYTLSANQGHLYSQMELGRMYLKGIGVSQDYSRAYEWLSKAADQGEPEAQVGLGYMYLRGDGIQKDYLKAHEWFRKSADQGNSQAAEALGIMYYRGIGVNKNYDLAFEWLSKGTEGILSLDAMYYLALMYYNGQGVKQDYIKAAEWYTKAAELWDAKSQCRLAQMYYDGKGVQQDYNTAIEWMTKAADKDFNAQFILGIWYYNGEGIKQDYNQSEFWIKKAIKQKPEVPNPYVYLSYIYSERDKNYKVAREYVEKAIDRSSQLDNEKKAAIYAAQGRIALFEGNDKEAQELLNKCIELNPGFMNSKNKFAQQMVKHHRNDVDNDIYINQVHNNNTFAIVLGNEKYRNEVDVPYAQNDAKVFSEYVEKTLGVPHDQIRHIENAGYNDLRIAINWLAQAMQVCRGKGKAIIYYAGHGIPNESDQSSYLLPVDGIGNDPGSAYALQELYDKLENVDAKSITIFLDACFSGSKREEGMLTSARGVAIKAKQSTPKGNLIIFSAAQGDETAYPYKDKQHGLFTYFLLKKLQETKGEVTLGELSEYLADEVGRQSFIKNNKIQTPTVSVSSSLQNSWKSIKLK